MRAQLQNRFVIESFVALILNKRTALALKEEFAQFGFQLWIMTPPPSTLGGRVK